MRLNKLKSHVFLNSLFLLLCLAQPLFSLTLSNTSTDNIKGSLKSYDSSHNAVFKNFEVKGNAEIHLDAVYCPEPSVWNPVEGCQVELNNEASPDRRATLGLTNANKDRMFQIIVADNAEYYLKPL
ncbi:MAG: hypothetical protein H0X26_09105 [Alphaproteobacteria bacterium]|nr:hypothetical protein [Alphaproteobacteria bacterium]